MRVKELKDIIGGLDEDIEVVLNDTEDRKPWLFHDIDVSEVYTLSPYHNDRKRELLVINYGCSCG